MPEFKLFSSFLSGYQPVLVAIDVLKIIAFIGIVRFIVNSTGFISKWLSIKEYQVNTNISEIDFALLDKLIADCFDEYMLTSGYGYAEYIDTETENKINKEMSELVKSRISPVILDKLSTVYNVSLLSDIIARKIYLFTTAFVVEKNKPKTTTE